jgi:prolyl-tRNA synthetase
MRYTQLITKTRKDTPKDELSLNAQLLIKAGFINKELAGVYDFLPLGLKVLNNIINVIRSEMNSLGGQEVFLSSLQDPEVWEKSGRWDDNVLDVWFKTNLNAGGELGLATTHEEPLTQLMSKFIGSYKDLPVYPYQFQTKFRNELRSKSGIMRTREFIMKDLYSFSKNQKEHDEFYEKCKISYLKIFKRLGIGDITFLTFASGGSFSKYSHEFQTVCEEGEDIIYLSRERNIAINKEVYNDEVLNELGLDKDKLEEVKAVEVGNIFPLGTKYSDSIGLNYTDEDGSIKPVVMGSYGIGPSRVMGTIVEISHDEKGIIWPKEISPFRIYLVGLNLENPEIKAQCDDLYEKLNSMNCETLYDDRTNVSPGVKFSDADLMGIPYRVVISEKTHGNYEFKPRTQKDIKVVEYSELINLISN